MLFTVAANLYAPSMSEPGAENTQVSPADFSLTKVSFPRVSPF